jgi:hypothetical protein
MSELITYSVILVKQTSLSCCKVCKLQYERSMFDRSSAGVPETIVPMRRAEESSTNEKKKTRPDGGTGGVDWPGSTGY